MENLQYIVEVQKREGINRILELEVKIPKINTVMAQRSLAFQVFEQIKALGIYDKREYDIVLYCVNQNGSALKIYSHPEEQNYHPGRQAETNSYIALNLFNRFPQIIQNKIATKGYNGGSVVEIVSQPEDAAPLKKILATISKIKNFQF